MTAAWGWLAYNPDDVRPGWGALGLVILLALVTYLLWRSMNTQLGKIQMPPSQPSSSAETPPHSPTRPGADDDDPPAAPDQRP